MIETLSLPALTALRAATEDLRELMALRIDDDYIGQPVEVRASYDVARNSVTITAYAPDGFGCRYTLGRSEAIDLRLSTATSSLAIAFAEVACDAELVVRAFGAVIALPQGFALVDQHRVPDLMPVGEYTRVLREGLQMLGMGMEDGDSFLLRARSDLPLSQLESDQRAMAGEILGEAAVRMLRMTCFAPKTYLVRAADTLALVEQFDSGRTDVRLMTRLQLDPVAAIATIHQLADAV
ncbi:hypothetical protein CKO28_03075 [Rhodovibrio sodomensis]|uniref:Uncharacterized protein n=1 Tax=Rhodovibrio sodomensis TaxID=1088 RepID=A0ABS1DAU2_9PROT|nr:hypothetical protein [Rhodovibrio sodomensis]MBK1667026.1 hypothetical protein [Rhodovibrio sodomensis]